MNIVIVPSWFPSPNNPINGSFFLEQAESIAKTGHHVFVIDCSYQDKSNYFRKTNFFKTINKKGNLTIISHTLPAFGIFKRNKTSFTLYHNRLQKIIKKIHLKYKIDIIHSHSYLPAGYIAGKIAKKYNIPHVITEHSSSIVNNIRSIDLEKYKATICNSDKIIAVGESLSRNLESKFHVGEKLVIIPNIVSKLFIRESTNKVSSGKFRFVSVGSLEIRKNHYNLIKAFARLIAFNSNFELNIIGNGLERKKLQELIDELELNDKIKLLGQKNRKDTAEIMREHDIFIMVSTAETFGVVYVEALMSGLPIIGLKNGGSEYIINEHNGILIQNNDIEEIFCAMKSVYEKYNSYNINRIIADAYEMYSEEKVVPRIINIYKEVIEKREINESKR